MAGSHDDLIKVIKINHNFSLMFGNECIVQASFGYFKRRSKSLAGILWYKEIQQSLTIVRTTADLLDKDSLHS